jgi:hypothetical protein
MIDPSPSNDSRSGSDSAAGAGATTAVTTHSASGVRLFTAQELAASAGSASVLRLAILGSVFDVSAGRKHYGEGGGYAFFAGRDGSKAFVSGPYSRQVTCSDGVAFSTALTSSVRP